MTKELFTGAVISLALHSVLVSWGQKVPPPRHPPRPKDPPTLIEMPPLDEEEKPQKTEDLPEEPTQRLLPVPALPDLPSLVPVDAFTEPLSPPPPPGLSPTDTVTIPVGNPNSNFRKSSLDIFDLDQLTQRPVARVQPQPVYPYEMSRGGIRGDVLVEFIINEHGDVTDTHVVRSSHREFETAATQAILKWKFKAGRKEGKPVKVRVSQLLEFNLDDLSK